MNERETLSIPEAARVLGISRSLAYEAARRGELSTIRIGKRYLVLKAPAASHAGRQQRGLRGRKQQGVWACPLRRRASRLSWRRTRRQSRREAGVKQARSWRWLWRRILADNPEHSDAPSPGEGEEASEMRARAAAHDGGVNAHHTILDPRRTA